MKYGDDISKEIITASCLNNSYSPFNVMLFEDRNLYFCSENSYDSWICFYFKNHQIIPTDYTIRTVKANNFHLKSWVIEGSNDNCHWEMIDEQRDNFSLNGPGLVHTFHIYSSRPVKCQYFRLRIYGQNHSNTNNLVIESLEIYGTLIPQD